MSENKRLEFFRRALGLCVKWNRSPQVARVIDGKARTLRQVMILLGEGTMPPAITTAEARTLAAEFTGFSHGEILAGLSSGGTTAAVRAVPRGARAGVGRPVGHGRLAHGTAEAA